MTLNYFRRSIRKAIANDALQAALDANAERRTKGRLGAFASLPDHPERRAHAHAIRADVIAHLDKYLRQFITKAQANGILVHRAVDSAEAVKIVLEIIQGAGITHKSPLLAKSKSMVSEEINLNHALEAAGARVVETDLGEYIVQLRGERPSHIITPAVHLRRQEVGRLFQEKLGIPYTEDIPTLTAAARRVLREVFLTADVGISGVNFGVVETGALCLITNEGNGRMVTTIPPVHIALMGIERLVPTLDDLALMLSLLPRSATGQKLSVYTSLIHAPRRAGDPDGPLERHLILVDNGRSQLRRSDLAEALYCIRCGACLNACPVFRELGGHAYVGTDGSIAPYPGPIGSVVSPGLFGLEGFGQLAQASSLCGACREACPVDIDLPELLLRVRAGYTPQRHKGYKDIPGGIGLTASLKLGMRAFRVAATSPRLFALSQRLAGMMGRFVSPASTYMRLPAFTGWGYSKDFPHPAARPFRARWKGIQQEVINKATGTMPQTAQPARPPAAGPLISQFADEIASLGGNIVRVPESDLPAQIIQFLRKRKIKSIYIDDAGAKHASPLREAGITLIREADPKVRGGPSASPRAGITGALAGIADTGTLVIVGGKGKPLTASLLPEIHVAILRAKDIYANLPQVLNLPEVRKAPAAVLISGPSRTADIEMTLTIGVHGPKELHVFLVE